MKPPVIALVLVLAANMTAQDAPEKTAVQPTTAKVEACTVRGVVVAAATGEPIKSAQVGLVSTEGSGRGLPQAYNGITDVGGHFVIKGIAGGRYRFVASRNGYIPQTYHPDPSSGSGSLLDLAPGEDLDKVQFRLVKASVILGRITDENGDPVAGVQMEALAFVGNATVEGLPLSKQQMVPIRTAVTNDLGEYRLYGLQPGSYYLAAIDSGTPELQEAHLSSGFAISAGLPTSNHPPLYYPGVTQQSEAQKIHLSAGQEARIDLALRTARMFTVSGRVFGPKGKPAGEAWVALRSQNLVTLFSPLQLGVQTDAQGKFAIKGVNPGSYTASVNLIEDGKQYSAQQPVEVAGENITGLQMQADSGMKLFGKVTVGAGSTLDLSGVRIWLSGVGGVDSGFGAAELAKDGTFTVADLHRTTYCLSVIGLSDGLYLASATFGSENVLEQGLNLTEGAGNRSLELVVASGAGRLEGVVMKGDDPNPGALVKLFPEHPSLYRKDLEKTAETDQHGLFIIKNVVPGSYRALVTASETDADEDDVEIDSSAGTKVVLTERETKTIQLKVEKAHE